MTLEYMERSLLGSACKDAYLHAMMHPSKGFPSNGNLSSKTSASFYPLEPVQKQTAGTQSSILPLTL
jgi:hypothetical protein